VSLAFFEDDRSETSAEVMGKRDGGEQAQPIGVLKSLMGKWVTDYWSPGISPKAQE